MSNAADLKRAYQALSGKAGAQSVLWDYYDGNAPIRYVSDRLYEVFKDHSARFTLNWAAVVIDAEHERITLKQIAAGKNEAAQARINELMKLTQLDLDAPEVHRASLITGEAYVFVWKAEDGQVEAYYNDPRLCAVFYDEENPRRKSFAAKWWVGGDGRRHLNLYYTDRIDYYVSKEGAETVQSHEAFAPAETPTAPNPFGQIPIFHFRLERRTNQSRLQNVIEPQDAINKLFTDMMVVAEFGAIRQRWIVTNADISTLKSSPFENWRIPAGDGVGEDTQVGEFDVTDLSNYLNAMDSLSSKIAVITRTPKHYIFAQGGDPSGESLIAMEAPLNKKVQAAIDHFKPTWVEVAAFMLQLDGTAVNPAELEAVFDRPETVQPRTAADIREINTRAGMPLRTTLRREGWTDAELAALDAEPADRKTAVQLATQIAAYVDRRTFLTVIAAAFGWNEQQVDQIYTLKQQETEQQALTEARGAVAAALDTVRTGAGGDIGTR